MRVLCYVQHLSGAGQVAFKQKQLLDAFERIGKVSPAQVAPAITGAPWGYRRRARLSVKHVAKKGGVLVGFREVDSPYVAQIESCVVLDPRVGLKLRDIAECVGKLNINTLVPQIEVAAAQTVTLVFRVMQAPTETDRAVLRAQGSWTLGNLARLRRSLEKLTPEWTAAERDAAWGELMAGYSAR